MAEENAGHTGGMVALIPRADDAEKLAVPRGDKADQMHLTLVYLGDDVAGMDTRLRNAIAAAVASAAVMLPPVAARVFGHATLNPDGHADRDPCAVYLVGDADSLTPLRGELSALAPQPQHEPFLAHVTAGYGVDARKLTYTGPVTFDRLRVALGEEYYDFPLGEPMQKGMHVLSYIETKRQFSSAQRQKMKGKGQANERGGFPLAKREDVKNAVRAIGRAKNPEAEKKRIMNAAKRLGCTDLIPDGWTGSKGIGTVAEWERFETKVMSPSPDAAKLREYWAHGEGRKKWRPGTPGDFKRLRRHLAKYVHNPHILDGLTANIHKLATGEWPGRNAHGGGRKDAMPTISAEEFKTAMLIADPDADFDLMTDDGGSLAPEGDDDEDRDGEEPESEDDAYEQALMDDFLWTIDADGQLEPDKDAPVDDEEGRAADAPGPASVAEYSLF